MVIFDQLNRKIELDGPPERIVSLVPSQTELLVDLGLEDRLVGVTRFCVHPHHIRKEKTVVGGTKQIKMDKIKDLNPDLILCNKEENTKAIVETLTSLYPLHVSDIYTLEDTYKMITDYGELFSVKTRAENLINRIKDEVKAFQKFIADKPRLKVAYFIWRKPWMVVGGNTFVNYLLEMNNFENVYADIPRYPEIDLKEIPPADMLLLSSEPFPFKEKHKKEIEAVVPGPAIEFVDGEYFSWYGSRQEAAFRYFKKWRETL